MSVIGSNLLAGASGQAGAAGYEIERSLRFNDDDSAYLSRTPSSSGNLNTWTWSGWVKRSNFTGNFQMLISAGNDSNNVDLFYFDADDTLKYLVVSGGSVIITFETDAVFRDCSAWYHIVAARSGSTFNVYVNGVSQSFQTSTGSTSNTFLSKASTAHAIGARVDTSYTYEFDGYLAELHFVDGTALAATDFGAFDGNGVWQPKAYSGSYGTNGFHLDFSDNTSTTTIAEDSSGNGNDWTSNNISVTAGAGNDSLFDSPTNGTQTDTGAGGEVSGNYCTFNNAIDASHVSSNGALEFVGTTGWNSAFGTMLIPNSGKWYYEMTAGGANNMAGIVDATDVLDPSAYIGLTSVSYLYYFSSGNKIEGPSNTQTAYGATGGNGDVMGVAFDMDAGTLTFYKNGTSQGTAFTGLTGSYLPVMASYTGSGGLIANFGQRAFAYTAPSGFKALCTANLDTPTIEDGSTAMDVALYTGNGSTQTISGLNFSPDLVWIKNRSTTDNHKLTDTVRGATKELESNTSDVEVTNADGLTAFNSDGFDLGADVEYNTNTESYVGWTWDAGTSTVSNTDGSITSSVRANTSAGFSIVSYTGIQSAATVGHGLNATPGFIVVKSRSGNNLWAVYHSYNGKDKYMVLDGTFAVGTISNYWGTTGPNSTTFGIWSGGGAINLSGANHIAYCWAPVKGYSAFGSYTGNGNADGPFVYTGFKPRWILVKSNSTIDNWFAVDTERDPDNLTTQYLMPNLTNVEGSTFNLDVLSNGFKVRASAAGYNGSGTEYIYAAFAEHPFKTARAR